MSNKSHVQIIDQLDNFVMITNVDNLPTVVDNRIVTA